MYLSALWPLKFSTFLMAFGVGPLWRLIPLHICSLSFTLSAAEAAEKTAVEIEKSASQRKAHIKRKRSVRERSGRMIRE